MLSLQHCLGTLYGSLALQCFQTAVLGDCSVLGLRRCGNSTATVLVDDNICELPSLRITYFMRQCSRLNTVFVGYSVREYWQCLLSDCRLRLALTYCGSSTYSGHCPLYNTAFVVYNNSALFVDDSVRAL